MTGHDQQYSLRQQWFIAAFVIGAIIIAFQGNFSAMWRLWVEIDTYNHCLLIAPACIWLIWCRKSVLATIVPSVSVAGLIAFAIVIGIWVLGTVAYVAVVQDFSVIGLILLSIWALLGTQTVRAIMFPLGYLFFIVPFGEFLVPPLMEFTADMTVLAVRVSGVAIYHDGLYFSIPNGSFKIIEACSGIRMLMAATAVGALFAYLNFDSWRRRTVFMVGVVILAIVANWIRAYIIVMTAHFTDMELVADHVWLGYVVFAVVMVIMLWVGSIYGDSDQNYGAGRNAPPGQPARPATRRTTLLATILIVGTVAVIPSVVSAVMKQSGQSMSWPAASMPAVRDGWFGPDPAPGDWAPRFSGDTTTQSGRYRGPTIDVDVYIISYRSLSQESELINETNHIYAPESWMLIGETTGMISSASGESVAYMQTEIQSQTDIRRLVRHWYVVDGQLYNSRVAVKLMELRNVFANRPIAAGVVAISARFDGDTAGADRALDTFMEQMIR